MAEEVTENYVWNPDLTVSRVVIVQTAAACAIHVYRNKTI